MGNERKPKFNMNGKSTLVIGRGRAGKSGFTLRKVLEIKNPKKIIIVPRITIPQLAEFDSIDWPVMNAQELARAWDECETEVLVVIYNPAKKEKGQPSIFEIIQDPCFDGFVIWADELAVLTSENDDKVAFKTYIRLVGQKNQRFYGTSHRIIDDIPPVTSLNVEEIYFIGRLSNKKEVQNLYDVSNVDSEMTLEQFEEKLKSQPKKYNWWDAKPDESAAFLIFY